MMRNTCCATSLVPPPGITVARRGMPGWNVLAIARRSLDAGKVGETDVVV